MKKITLISLIAITILTAITIILPSLAYTRYTREYYKTFTDVYATCAETYNKAIKDDLQLTYFCAGVSDCVADKMTSKIENSVFYDEEKFDEKAGKILHKCRYKVAEKMASKPEIKMVLD